VAAAVEHDQLASSEIFSKLLPCNPLYRPPFGSSQGSLGRRALIGQRGDFS